VWQAYRFTLSSPAILNGSTVLKAAETDDDTRGELRATSGCACSLHFLLPPLILIPFIQFCTGSFRHFAAIHNLEVLSYSYCFAAPLANHPAHKVPLVARL
jgi:hypothetical protein